LLVDVSDEEDDYEIINSQQNDNDDLESVVTYSGNRFNNQKIILKSPQKKTKIPPHIIPLKKFKNRPKNKDIAPVIKNVSICWKMNFYDKISEQNEFSQNTSLAPFYRPP
jgi:hypothetical protein